MHLVPSRRPMHALLCALAISTAPLIAGAQQQPAPQPQKPDPTVPGEQTKRPPEAPQRPGSPPQSAPKPANETGGVPPLVPNAYASTYPLMSSGFVPTHHLPDVSMLMTREAA